MCRTAAILAVFLPVTALAADPLDDPPARPAAVARPVGVATVRQKLGLLPEYAAVPGIRAIKVAVLDYGFEGVDGKRAYLPANTVMVEHYDAGFVQRFGLGDPAYRKPFVPGNTHGRLMAQLVWATTGNSPDGPQFYLLNANGPTLFRRAVRYAIEQKVDVILFSGTFEGAGNYDGRGPINAAVDEAITAGIIWVNAAGNDGGSVYNGPVNLGPDGFLRFASVPDATGLRFTNRLDENAVTITLTWNDYRDTEDAGTDKDLDLIVTDGRGRVVGKSTLKQVPAGRVAGENETKNPRERVVLTDLPAAPAGEEYRIRVKANSANFGPRDRIRIVVTPARNMPITDPDTDKSVVPVEFLDATHGGEIYPPADHPGVLAVGDTSRVSSVGPTADGRVKPDVILPGSVARFSNGEESVGSSNTAAYFAGVVAVMRATEPGLTTGHIRAWVRTLDARQRQTAAAPQLLPSAFPSRLLPPPPGPIPDPSRSMMSAVPGGVGLSPNQTRAMKYAEYAMNDRRRQPGVPPYIIMSTPGGTFHVQPGGRLVPYAPLQADPAVPARIARASPPVSEPQSEWVHAPWITPSPKALADLVRGP